MTTNDLPKIQGLTMSVQVRLQSWLNEGQLQTVEIQMDKDGGYKVFPRVGETLSEDEKENILAAITGSLAQAKNNAVGQVTMNKVTVSPGDKASVEIDFSDPQFQGLQVIIPKVAGVTLLKCTYSRYVLTETSMSATDKEKYLFFSISDELRKSTDPRGIELLFDVRSVESPEYGIEKTATIQVLAKGTKPGQLKEIDGVPIME